MAESFVEHEKSTESLSNASTKEILEDSDQSELPELEPLDDVKSEDNINCKEQTKEETSKPEEETSKPEEETPKPEWVDLLGSGAIMKKIVVEGEPNSRPRRNEKCVINYSCYLEDETLIQQERNFELNLGESDVIQGLDICLGLMNINETCKLKIEPRLAYGKKGLPPKIPSDAVVIFEVQLVSVEPEDDIDTMAIAQRRKKGNKKRERGNWWYTRGENTIAIQCYRRALDYLDEVEGGDNTKGEVSDSDLQSILEDRISVYNNMAAAHIKIEQFGAALNSLQIVLRCQPDNVKAHFRKAKAYIGQNDLPTAMKCLQKAKELSPNDPEIQKEMNNLSKMLLKQKMSEKELAKRMFNGSSKSAETNKKAPEGRKIFLWATIGAAVAAGVAGVVAYRLKI
ncbi:peptidyl-prolyl cis-trans isomerase FKBP8 [Diorhabda sublineata]|uniref:peptidyl-prolyl cis-trans isomerase FKBP8 n=1 Tax=Diorhabda sublineata TaxID=1163346 RepID=UPI0024E0726A|nr:peptidyl-prolyl cis-trans isomerase FKBP8 [Diorhabda sublineata]